MLTFLGCNVHSSSGHSLRVGSKKFTESVILSEIVGLLAGSGGEAVEYKKELGGTSILWDALVNGDIDIYPEYTGTVTKEILSGRNISSANQLASVLSEYGVLMSPPLGFNNTYALGMKKELADRLGITSISDLRKHPGLRLGFTNEFMDRKDGWPGLQKAYGLPQKNVAGLDHDLAYRALDDGNIDVTDLYSTDAEIEYYDLKVLKDDLKYFPEYQAVLLYRKELEAENPETVNAVLELSGKLSEEDMRGLNESVQIEGVSAGAAASKFLKEKLDIDLKPDEDTFFSRLYRNTIQHLFLVAVSLCAAIIISIPLGVAAFRNQKTGHAILAVVGVIQTIPSLALLVFMIPFFGIGTVPAIAALFLYSLLPIVRNTYSGLEEISPDIRESGEALGLGPFARLRLIEIPLASRSILSGIKTSAVINVGTATLGALIGAGGYGQPILTGIRLNNIGLILEGAIPAALLALLVQWLFGLSERIFVPAGLRLKDRS
jgi:osmoprotectant transport system substrate-binding protein/osmoprotectant transport system permease protein